MDMKGRCCFYHGDEQHCDDNQGTRRAKVITLDIPGAFLNADLEEEVIMLLRGEMVDLMLAIDPALYGPYVIERRKVALCENVEGHVWAHDSGLAILFEAQV
eukprot:CCRYP_011399-RA/>CCRYP_011399-RA protein AED:0.46 eAED:0.60 QI:0/0/0/1/0/0/2/0/101